MMYVFILLTLLVVFLIVCVGLGVYGSISTRLYNPNNTITLYQHEHPAIPNLKMNFRAYVIKRNAAKGLLDLLGKVIYVFMDSDVPYFAIAGTLLGQQRHGGFIPWDDDIDLGVLASDLDLMKSAVELDDSLEWREGGNVLRISYKGINYPFIDIVPFAPIPPDGIMAGCYPVNEVGEFQFAYHKQYPRESYPEEWIFPTQQASFEHLNISIPAKPGQCVDHTFTPASMTDAKPKGFFYKHLPWLFNHKVGRLFH
jgi:hypothetical protein